MGLADTLYTSLTGLNGNSSMLSVAGNNIANVNTTAFKRSRVVFETQISRTMRNGSVPTETTGGSNPAQIGLGTRMSSIRRDFTNGPLQPTGVNTDVAIDGNGFFIVDAGGSRYYTRSGNFALDRDFNLVNPNGAMVKGYTVDSDYNIVEGVLSSLNIPIGILTLAEPTTTVKFAGNLNAGGDVATQGAAIETQVLYSDSGAGSLIDANTQLASVYNSDGDLLFQDGDVITFTGEAKGGATLPTKTFKVGALATGETYNDSGSTVQDLMDFFTDVLGLDVDSGAGISITDGKITFLGNTGEDNDLLIDDANFIVNQTTAPSVPLSFLKTQAANGESVRTTFVSYDSLGNPMTLDMTVVLEEKTGTGTSWRFYCQSEDDSDLSRHLGTGLMSFDTSGQLVTVTEPSVTVDRVGTGAFSPQKITFSFADEFGSVSALYDITSQMSAIYQDGTPIGTLEDFSIGEDGVITGIFSNSLLRSLGQITLAMFANNEGLEEMGANLYRPSVNSGTATVVAPQTSGSGRVIGRSLELANVELADEFVTLINASTGFSANSRVLTTADQLMQELLSAVR